MKKIIKAIIAILIICAIVLLIGMSNKNFKKSLVKIKDRIFHTNKVVVGYNAKSLVAIDLEYGEVYSEKNPDELIPPASLTKLFVIDFASTLVKNDEIITPSKEVLGLVKEGSSVANITTKKYTVENIYAAMLVPSGNDAAYVLADYVAQKIDKEEKDVHKRQEIFKNELKKYLSKKGYTNTVINDPSGFDYNGMTNTKDLKKVIVNLLKHKWFRNIVSSQTYTAKLPDGTLQTFKNTNVYLDKNNKTYYKEGVKGAKTGSLGKDFNLAVLYEHKGKEFLIVSLGSESNDSRYDDVAYVLKTIDDSYYLYNKKKK